VLKQLDFIQLTLPETRLHSFSSVIHRRYLRTGKSNSRLRLVAVAAIARDELECSFEVGNVVARSAQRGLVGATHSGGG
jgi:hypothetical protein